MAERGARWLTQIPHLLLGAAAVGMVLLAGHPEMDYYVALTAAAMPSGGSWGWRGAPIAASPFLLAGVASCCPWL